MMDFAELMPASGGLLLGAILGWLPPALRARAAVLAGLVLAVGATVASGEFRVSWAFVAADAALVAVAAALGFALGRAMRAKASG